MIAIESVNMWQRNNDQRWSICITVRTNVSKKMKHYQGEYTKTECVRIQHTTPNTANRGMNEALKFLESIQNQTKLGQMADPNMQGAD